MANPELGAKQICPTCQSKFYDLGRRPALCPKCGASFDPEEAIKVRRVRTRGATPDYEDKPEAEAAAKPAEETEEGFEDEVEDTPEIDAAVEAEPLESDDEDIDPSAPPAAPDNDIGVDFEEDAAEEEEADGVPFLEDEDDDFPDEEIEGIPNPDEET